MLVIRDVLTRTLLYQAIELYEKALPLVETNAHSAKWLAHHTSSYGEILRKVRDVSTVYLQLHYAVSLRW